MSAARGPVRAGGNGYHRYRPPSPDALDRRMEILVSEGMRDAVLAASGEAGATMGAWVRRAIAERLAREADRQGVGRPVSGS
jgi:hypothetical protein